MLSFATEFPVDSNRSVADFLSAIVTWISKSPHTSFSVEKLEELQQKIKEADLKSDNERIHSLIVSSPEIDCAAIQYTKKNNEQNCNWLTSVVFSKKSSDTLVGIRVECDASQASPRLPVAKKPVVIKTLLEALGGAKDGTLPISGAAHHLCLSNTDIELAAKLIRGNAGCRLPIVYVTSPFHGGYILDENRLAADLSGMAHVVIEPNRPFSVRLQLEVNSANVYGGTIGIYWPDGGGQRDFFLGTKYANAKELAQAIKDEIWTALQNRRPTPWCTWGYVREIASQQAIQSLKASGSKEINDYIEAFDKENKAKEQRIKDTEREIERLNSEIRRLEARTAVANSDMLKRGEQDLYPNETLGILIDVIKKAADSATKDSRRQHVLQAILNFNPLTDSPSSALREELKNLLKDMKTITPKIRRGLEKMGFSISEDGKHFKLVFQGDDRYTFSLPKSGSDWRGGLNAASDIANLLF